MKIISTLTLIAVVAAFITPNTAKAGDKEKAILGGLIGGIIIGSVIADDHYDTHVSVGYNSGRHHERDGYWNWVSVKRWTPGYYERSCDRHGRVRKVWISGHYTWTKEKVWVSARSNYRPDDSYGNRDGRYDRRYDRRVGRYEGRGY